MIYIIFILLFAFLGYGWFIEPAQLLVRNYSVRVKQADLRQKKSILFISDLHASRFVFDWQIKRKLAKIKNEANKNKYDLLLLGGDYIDWEKKYAPQIEKIFAGLLELKLPTYGVMGNHDYKAAGCQEVIERIFEKFKFTLLKDESVEVVLDKDSIILVGIDDLEHNQAYRPGYKKLAAEQYRKNAQKMDSYKSLIADQKNGAVVLLSHNPDAVYLTGERRPAVVLSGHTHGGQFGIPDIFFKWLQRFAPQSSFIIWAGQQIMEKTTLIVSRGFGGSLIPFRFTCPPEIVRIDLVPTTEKEKELVIGLGGKPRAGKDTVANMLHVLLPDMNRVAFGNSIKIEYDAEHGTNTLGNEQEKSANRDGLQELGNKRRAENIDYWIEKTLTEKPPLLITDVRNEREVNAVKSHEGHMIKISAEEHILQERLGEYAHQLLHPNEKLLDHFNEWDYVVHNNHGVVELEQEVRAVVADLVKD